MKRHCWTDEMDYVQVFWSLAFKDWETNKQKAGNMRMNK